MIELVNVSKSYGNVKAVNDISLAVGEGELFSFLGPNGAGKTTTIKMLVGLLQPDAGTIRVNGIDMSVDPVGAKRHSRYVPDVPFLYERLTGLEYLTLIGNLYDIPADALEQEINFYVTELNIGDWLHHRVEGYSHGMKQRLIFASAFLHEPKVLIIDEPMVGLDPQSARIIKQLLKAKKEAGTSIFLSTHNLYVAEELSDRVGIINKGNVLATGTIDELKAAVSKDSNLEDLFLQIVEEPSDSPPAGTSEA